ncbi:hypothetical protein C1645_831685 [Glomus cerebriforme]|uniref:Uncharacterized protein n=1 Tax=Glomus cerebriforme TaxID=658196 RepID=A0A397SF10_9GLOM|nr:hypothetical protein C1645_831685 [Glomus cerebriforme]
MSYLLLPEQAKKLITLEYKEAVYNLLQQIRDINNNEIEEWLSYYQQLYVLASLNQFISNIDPEIWLKSGSNTNNTEAAYFMENDLMKDVTKQLRSIINQDISNQKNKKSVIDLISDKLYTKPSSKRNLLFFINENKLLKKNQKEKNKEILTINKISELEIEERKMALKERAAKVRKKEAEAEVLEIANTQKKRKKDLIYFINNNNMLLYNISKLEIPINGKLIY